MNTKKNSSFKSNTKKTMAKSTMLTVDDLNLKNITFGTVNKKGSGKSVNIMHTQKPLNFQARGLLLSYAGTSKKPDNLKEPVLNRRYWLSINGEHETCQDENGNPLIKGGKSDGPALFKFTKGLGNLIRKELETKSGEWGLQKEVTLKGGKKELTDGEYVDIVSEGKPIVKDGAETGENYPCSIQYSLRFKADEKDYNKKYEQFTTKFINARTGELMKITPDNINEVIGYGTFCVLSLSYGRLWLGDGKCKLTVYVNEAKLLLPKKTMTTTDDFLVAGESEENSSSTEDENEDEKNASNNEEDSDNVDEDLIEALKEVVDEPEDDEKPKPRRGRKRA